MNTEQAKKDFQRLFGEVNESAGYSLSAKKVKSGILVMMWYERNSWVDPQLEKKVLFSNGIVYENNKQVATY